MVLDKLTPDSSTPEIQPTAHIITSLDKCSDGTYYAALELDSHSFPKYLVENGSNIWFTWLLRTFKKYQVVIVDKTNQVLAAGFSGPIHLDNEQLPPNGWDGAVTQIRQDYANDREPNALVGFSASVSPATRGQGLGDQILQTFVAKAKELGLSHVIVPARPSDKKNYPNMTMDEYLNLRDEKGVHHDPWIRAHERCGGRVAGIGKDSHSVVAPDGSWPTTQQWETWTDMQFPTDGQYDIGGNAKLIVHDGVGRYQEDCIWIVYDVPN